MQNMSIPTTFSIDFIGQLEKVSELISKVGARIYYKGGNPNGTWITDEFSGKLNSTLPHIPIVASYNQETKDFEGHEDNGTKKAYGFIPTDPNSHWEKGEDGKEYLVSDVYLWTGYWPEAAEIINKSQSMEIEPTSIMGDWKVIGGEYYFVYQNAAFKGLCALGDTVLPCFENAAFYTLDKETRSFFDNANKISEENLGGGNEKMIEGNKDNFVEIVVEEIPITATNIVEDTPEVFTEELTNTEIVTEPENFAEESTPAYKEDSATVVERHTEVVGNADGSTTRTSSESVQNIAIETYYALQKENEELKVKIVTLETENASLTVYKASALKQEKQTIIEQFKKKLSDTEISECADSIDNYTAEELKAKLSIVLAYKTLEEKEIPTAPQTQFVTVPGQIKEDGIATILRKNKKK